MKIENKLHELKIAARDAQFVLLEATADARDAEIKFCSDVREIFRADDRTTQQTAASHRAAVLAYKDVIRVFHDAQQALEEINDARKAYED